jgi:hypothetical protein
MGHFNDMRGFNEGYSLGVARGRLCQLTGLAESHRSPQDSPNVPFFLRLAFAAYRLRRGLSILNPTANSQLDRQGNVTEQLRSHQCGSGDLPFPPDFVKQSFYFKLKLF